MMTRKDYIATAEILNKHFENAPAGLLLDFSNMFKSFLFLVFKCNKTKTFIKSLIKRMKLQIKKMKKQN